MTYSYNVEYSEEAYEDLREIYDYVANELLVPKTAENLLKNIRTAIRSLSNMPYRHTLVDWDIKRSCCLILQYFLTRNLWKF